MGRKTLISFDYGHMLKSIVTARSECTTKHENRASYSIEYIVPNLTGFSLMIGKRLEHSLKE